MFNKEIFSDKLNQFKKIFPKESRVTCVSYVDWSSDSYLMRENDYSLHFLEIIFPQKNGIITYKSKGEYRHRHDPKSERHCLDKFQLSEKVARRLWVHNWEATECRYLLCELKPKEKVLQGCCSFYDYSFKKEDLLIFYEYSEHPQLNICLRKTQDILKAKYEKLKQVALTRNYKYGWIYHQMKEPIELVVDIWQEIGCYFLFEKEAFNYMYEFKHET